MTIIQAITDQISLGAEIVARGHAIELSSASGAGRWANEEQSISATLGNRGLDLCYARAIKPYLTVAAMLEVRCSRKGVANNLRSRIISSSERIVYLNLMFCSYL